MPAGAKLPHMDRVNGQGQGDRVPARIHLHLITGGDGQWRFLLCEQTWHHSKWQTAGMDLKVKCTFLVL